MKSLSLLAILFSAIHAFATDKDLECQSLAEFAQGITFPESARFVTGEEQNNIAESVLGTIDDDVGGKKLDLNHLKKQISESKVYFNHGKIQSGSYSFEQLTDIDLYLYVVTKKPTYSIEPEYETLGKVANDFLTRQKAKFLLYHFNISPKDRCRCHIEKSVKGWFTLNCKWNSTSATQPKVDF